MSDTALSERLRAETKDLHSAAERAGIMPALLRGELALGRYCALLRNLLALYVTMESALTRHANHADVAPVFFPALFRQASLADDLAVLHGPGWAERFALQPATLAYVARLQDIEARQPELLAAHAYVRYLGDLSGGQMLHKIVARSYGLLADEGASFYGFGDSAAVQAHLQTFRAGLAALASPPARIDALVAEARAAFGRHVDLFNELALAPDQALPTKLRI
jgi:heme oxygenase (biliverdin-producing, ferredoxin)